MKSIATDLALVFIATGCIPDENNNKYDVFFLLLKCFFLIQKFWIEWMDCKAKRMNGIEEGMELNCKRNELQGRGKKYHHNTCDISNKYI